MERIYFFIYFRLLQCSDQSEENIDTQSTQSSHLRGSTPKIWNHHTTSWRNGANNSISPTTQLSETKLSPGRIELDHDEKPKKTKKSKLCLILWYRKNMKCVFFSSQLYWSKYKWYILHKLWSSLILYCFIFPLWS